MRATRGMRLTAEVRELVYTAHSKQKRFHQLLRTHDAVLFAGGRGSGKTTAGAIEAIRQAVNFQPGKRGVVVVPTYPMLRDATMPEVLRWLPPQLIAAHLRSEHTLRLKNGSEIAFRSATDPNSLRGPNRAWAWFDEPRNLRTREAYDIVIGQLRPTHKVWLTSTPSGVFHWLYDLFIANPLPESAVVSVRSDENPNLPADYAASLRAQYTGAFARQELDAMWVSFEGLIYDNFSLDENVSAAADYDPSLPVIWGVDDGYAEGQGVGTTSYHPRVFLFAQETAQGGIHIFDELYAVNELQEATIARAMSKPYEIAHIAFVDSSAAELKGRLWQAGLQTVGATHAVSEGIKNVRRLIGGGDAPRLLKVHPRCTNLIRELQSYRYDDATNAVVGERKPLKLDDHGADCIRYLCFHLRYA